MKPDIESKEEAVNEELRLALQHKEMMLNLLSFKPFVETCKLLQIQIDKRMHEILTMPMTQDDLVKKTYASGEIAGLKIAINFPQTLLDGAISEIEFEKKREEMENGTEE